MKKKKQQLLAGLAVLVFAMGLCLTGCGKQKQEVKENADDDGIQIGITFDTFVLERWESDRDVFVSTAEDLGATVNVQLANGDIEKQAEQIDYFIEKGMDAIVVIQVADDKADLVDAIARAKAAGIPVVCYDRLVLNADVDLYISFDNEMVGYLMGQHIADHLGGKGNVLQICGPLSDHNVEDVMKGFNEAIEGTDIKVLDTQYAEGWTAEYAYDYTEDFLNEYGSVDAIMGGNDALAGQAIKVLSAHSMAGKVCVTGQDADLDACQRIVEGTQCMTVFKPVEKLAKRAAQLTVALAKGENLTDVADTVDNGYGDIPFEKLEPIAVDADNMDDEITGVYHEESDIYLNVPRDTEDSELGQ